MTTDPSKILHATIMNALTGRRNTMPKGTPLTDAFVADLKSEFPSDKITLSYGYSGSGDEGWFNGYSVRFGNKFIEQYQVQAIAKPDANNEWQRSNMQPEDADRARRIAAIESKHDLAKIERELYEILESREPGWEINEGSDGAFVFHPDGSRMHEHSENILTTNERYREF